MSFLLHTDTCSSVVRNVRNVANRFAQNVGNVHVSAISLTGLELWLLRFRTPLHYRQKFFNIIAMTKLINLDEPIAHRAAMLGNKLRHQGQRIGLADLIIAATAVEHNLSLVTRKLALFAAIPSLTIVDWNVP